MAEIDMEKDVSVGIKIFLRTDCLERTLQQLSEHNFAEIIIADDGPEDPVKESIFKKFDHLPLKILKLPFDTGLAQGRNEIVDVCQTKYLLMLDDDQGVRQDIWKLKEIMDNNPNMGGVSCIWDEYGRERCSACNIYRYGRVIVKELPKDIGINGSSENRYAIFDFIPNSTLFRTECLKEYPWDPFYKIGSEHLDFYLQHLETKWQFAVALDVTIDHYPDTSNTDYKDFRHGDRKKKSLDYLLQKNNIGRIIEGSKYIGTGDKNYQLLKKLRLPVWLISMLLVLKGSKH